MSPEERKESIQKEERFWKVEYLFSQIDNLRLMIHPSPKYKKGNQLIEDRQTYEDLWREMMARSKGLE